MRVETFTMRQFEDRGPDGVEELSCLAPDAFTGVLKRGPEWSAGLALPSGISEIAAAFFIQDIQRYCFIGENSGDMVLAYTDDLSSWSGPYTLISGKTLGGLTNRNVQYWGGYLWVIDEDGDVYRGTDYTTSLASYYTSSNVTILQPMNDRLFAADEVGVILRHGTGGMSAYHTPVGALNIIALIPYRQYLTVVALGDDDTLRIYRLPDYAAHGLHELGCLPTQGYINNDGPEVALYQDRIYILTGQQRLASLTEYQVDVYAFDGQSIELAARATARHLHTTQRSGLLVWNDRLVFYELDAPSLTGLTFDLLVGDRFVEYAPMAASGGYGQMTPFACVMGERLVTTAYKSTQEKVFTARRTTFQDGYVVTARLDMGQPGRVKRLESLTALLDGADDDFYAYVKYRLDDATSWSTGVAQAGTHNVYVGALGLAFTQLQVRVDLIDTSDDSNLDIGVEALSVVYTIDE